MSTPGFGTKFQFGTIGADPTQAATGWTDVAEVVEISPPEREKADISTFHMQSSGGVKTYRSGNEEPGEASISLHWDPTLATTLDTAFGVSKAFRVVFSDNTGRAFNGYIKKIGEKVEIEDLVMQEISVKVSGPVTKFTIA
jgi:hypothetical protein